VRITVRKKKGRRRGRGVQAYERRKRGLAKKKVA